MQSIRVSVKTGQTENDYEVIKHDDNYKVSQRGAQVAELQYEDDWQQLSGAPLPDGVIEEIIRAVEINYDPEI